MDLGAYMAESIRNILATAYLNVLGNPREARFVAKMQRTIIIRRDYLHYIPKYNRYEKRHATMAVHCSPCFRVKEGDRVTIGECRPLSKTVKYNVLKVEDLKKIGKKHRKQFTKF